jgi:crotonobetainyl-CoA:carnitine CoA-transferase CaiB-like acyl-CoA transferase
VTQHRPELPEPPRRPTGPAPLDGVRVVDFTRVLAGPFGTQILGDLGADVIKIENPKAGDDTRSVRPEAVIGGETPMFLSLNRSKRSVALDLGAEEGRQVALDLIASADVLVENFSGKVMRRFGLDYPSLRERFPKLIYCSVSGYGRSGRNADAAGYDSPVSAETGVLAVNAYQGGTPVLGAIPYTDTTTALNAVIGILAALHSRSVSGWGQHVDVAMFDSALANLSFNGCEYLATGREPTLYTPQVAGPRGVFETADGGIVITCGNDKMFQALCLEVLDRPDWVADPRFATIPARMRNAEAFLAEIGAIFRTQPRAVWSERCKRAGIPCGPVRSAGEALLSQEAMDRELVFGLPHPIAGTAPVIAQPFRFSETPCRYEVPPLLGQHTREVLRALPGYDDARIDELASQSVIRMAEDAAPALAENS